MAPVSLVRQLLSAAGLGGGLSWVPASTGSDAAAHAKYRPDIDGLRAVAVLPVLFYHLGISLTPGGFVGVDIFFVISGYLITGLISAEMHEGTYSIRNFYVRRARRIFPALFFMCAVTALFVLLFCLPSDAKRFSSSLAAATLFGSNVYFYLTADYFGAAAETQPLLHTWSLAVEEQFYIVFPLILLLVRRYFGQRERQVMVVLALLSLALSIWLVRTDQAGAFYLLHSRAWELLLGALLALGTFPAIRSRLLAGALGILGLALIAGSVLLYREAMPFPGLAALAPCIGAALLIHTGKDASLLSARALSLAPVRFIGLISYSLYLWHWPIDVIARYFAFWYGWDPDLKLHKLALLALSFGAAILSWHYVERPFRQRPYRLGSTAILSASAATMALLVIAAGVVYPLSQRFWQMPERAERVLATLDYRPTNAKRACFLGPKTNDFHFFNQARLPRPIRHQEELAADRRQPGGRSVGRSFRGQSGDQPDAGYGLGLQAAARSQGRAALYRPHALPVLRLHPEAPVRRHPAVGPLGLRQRRGGAEDGQRAQALSPSGWSCWARGSSTSRTCPGCWRRAC